MNNTLANGLELLAVLSGTAEAYSVTELAQRLDLPKSHVHRLLQTLVATGYAIQDEDRRYRIGMAPLVISKALLANHPLRREARPLLHRLAESLGMDGMVAIPDAGRALVIGAIYPGGEQRDAAAAIGNLLAFPGTATGRLYAALVPGFAGADELPADERRAIARDGLAIKDPSLEVGVNGIAAAIFDAEGAVIGSLGLSAPREAFNANLDRTRHLLREAAATITASLAHRPTA